MNKNDFIDKDEEVIVETKIFHKESLPKLLGLNGKIIDVFWDGNDLLITTFQSDKE